MSRSTLSTRNEPVSVQLSKGGRVHTGYIGGEPYTVTKAAAARRARTLGLKPGEVPSGEWVSVCLVDLGWREVPVSLVRR